MNYIDIYNFWFNNQKYWIPINDKDKNYIDNIIYKNFYNIKIENIKNINDNNDIYKDRQNIHNSNIQQSFRNSLSNILKDKLSYSLDHCKNELLKSNCSEEVKRELINFCDDYYADYFEWNFSNHSNLGLDFR